MMLKACDTRAQAMENKHVLFSHADTVNANDSVSSHHSVSSTNANVFSLVSWWSLRAWRRTMAPSLNTCLIAGHGLFSPTQNTFSANGIYPCLHKLVDRQIFCQIIDSA